MLLLHLADVHLGARFARMGDFGSRARNALREALSRACDLALERRVDAVLIAGNLFDSGDPPSADIACVRDCLGRLSSAGVPVFVLPGSDPNHDPPEAPVWRRRLPALPSLHLLLDEEPVVLPDRRLVVHPRLGRPSRFSGCRTGRAGFVEIGIAHGDCLGVGGEPDLSKEDLEGSGLEYVALGHYHRPYKAASNAWYPGSPGFLALDEAGRGEVLLVEAEAGGASPRVERVAVGPFEVLPPREVHPGAYASRDELLGELLREAASDAVALVRLVGEAEAGLSEWLREQLAERFAFVAVEDETVASAGFEPRNPLERALVEAAARRGDERSRRALSYLLSLLRGGGGR